jgi:hypothetical protein
MNELKILTFFLWLGALVLGVIALVQVLSGGQATLLLSIAVMVAAIAGLVALVTRSDY